MNLTTHFGFLKLTCIRFVSRCINLLASVRQVSSTPQRPGYIADQKGEADIKALEALLGCQFVHLHNFKQ